MTEGHIFSQSPGGLWSQSLELIEVGRIDSNVHTSCARSNNPHNFPSPVFIHTTFPCLRRPSS
jgi:hypothetical protein